MNPIQLTIRQATLDDLGSLHSFQTSMAKETEDVVLDSVVLTAGLQTLLTDPSKGKYYIAVADAIPVACLMTTFEWSEWRNGTVIWIQSVYVTPVYRGRGVYRNMYEHIKNLVIADSGLRGIRLYADFTNHEAQKVYNKAGMNGDHYKVFEWMKS